MTHAALFVYVRDGTLLNLFKLLIVVRSCHRTYPLPPSRSAAERPWLTQLTSLCPARRRTAWSYVFRDRVSGIVYRAAPDSHLW